MFPHEGIPATRASVEEWMDGVVELGFDHVVLPDHVLGADPDLATPGWNDQWAAIGDHPHDHETVFHEPFVLFGFLAARCELELVTGVLVLPQRQTALVAKQAVEADLLSEGRLRLCVGVGWNAAEYEALGVPFHQRGRILNEQIEVLRLLWTHPVVTYEGEFHHLHGVGTQALPVQRPIPLWCGGRSPRALERAGRVADGWLSMGVVTPPVLAERLEVIRTAATAAGRDPAEIGLELRLDVTGRSAIDVTKDGRVLAGAGATHVCVSTHGTGPTATEHVAALRAATALTSGALDE